MKERQNEEKEKLSWSQNVIIGFSWVTVFNKQSGKKTKKDEEFQKKRNVL